MADAPRAVPFKQIKKSQQSRVLKEPHRYNFIVRNYQFLVSIGEAGFAHNLKILRNKSYCPIESINPLA